MGASHLRFVLATADGAIRTEAREQVKAEAGPAGVIAQLRDGIANLIRKSGAAVAGLQGIAIGVPGGVDPQSGKVIDANNVPGWREVDMGRALEDAFGVPVFLDNDANMAAIGEHWRGVAQGVDNFVFIALGTGIGSGVFVNGRICRGRSGFAGELFRMNLDWKRWNEDFPDTGYLEAHVSGWRWPPKAGRFRTPETDQGAERSRRPATHDMFLKRCVRAIRKRRPWSKTVF